MKTVVDLVHDMAKSVRADIETLALQHSALERFNDRRSSGIVFASGDYHWVNLEQIGRRVQARTLENYRRFFALLRVLAKELPTESQNVLEDCNSTIMEVIEQNGSTWSWTVQEELDNAMSALAKQVGIIDDLYGEAAGHPVLVPDTNVLLYNPDLEQWRFTDYAQFVIALIPTVLMELDELKINHRNESVRAKAEGLIRRIKGYRARGILTEGVTLVRGVSELVAIAAEPDFSKTLPWLDRDNNDDRIIASFIEVMRSHPRVPVVLVTRDINVQNKAEFASLPFVEPPEPSSAERTS